MTDRDYESVKNFIRTRYEEVIRNEAETQAQQTLKGVSVRLPEGWIAVIDMLAQELELNRQGFLYQLLGEALQESIQTMADFAPEEQRAAVYRHYLETMWGKEGGNDE